MMKTVLTIFGATGNLMHIKLVPALIRLFKSGHLNNDTSVICVSRRDYNQEMYYEHLLSSVSPSLDLESIKNKLTYFQMDLQNPEDYQNLKKKIELTYGNDIQSLFYLAVSPEFFVEIAQGISQASLVEKGNIRNRVVFEKPFGHSFESAKSINTQLENYFTESQIYRIDHYLGKDMIQNILVMRFGNIVFENNWSRDSIEKIDILVKEHSGIGNRGSYYDQSGAMNDMVQSHLLQMLALITMEPPKSLDSAEIRKNKIEVLKKTTIDNQSAIFGQYIGYLSEQGIPSDSSTETFVCLKAQVDTPRFKDVPIYLITGKKLDEKIAEIIIHFKEHTLANTLWPNQKPLHNQLVIGVSEYEGVRFQMNFKTPGLNDNLVETSLDYCHSCQKIGNNPEAYEKLLKDFIENTPTLFTSWDEIEASWKIVDPIDFNRRTLIHYADIDDLRSKIRERKGREDIDL